MITGSIADPNNLLNGVSKPETLILSPKGILSTVDIDRSAYVDESGSNPFVLSLTKSSPSNILFTLFLVFASDSNFPSLNLLMVIPKFSFNS